MGSTRVKDLDLKDYGRRIGIKGKKPLILQPYLPKGLSFPPIKILNLKPGLHNDQEPEIWALAFAGEQRLTIRIGTLSWYRRMEKYTILRKQRQDYSEIKKWTESDFVVGMDKNQ